MSDATSSKYQEQNDVQERPRFFDGQFLVDYDFIQEQAYHIDRQRIHNRALHISGIATGLQVTTGANDYEVTVGAGTAVDQTGRQIILKADCTLDVTQLGFSTDPADKPAANSSGYLHLAYNQVPATSTLANQQGLKGQTRWVELPCLFWYASPIKSGDGFPPNNNWAAVAGYCATQSLCGDTLTLSDNEADWQWGVWTAVAPPPLLLAKLTIDTEGKITVEDKRTFSVGIGTAVTASTLNIRSDQASLLRLENSQGNRSEVHLDLATFSPGTAPPLDPSARISAIDDINFSNHIAFLTKQPGDEANKLTERLRFTSDGKVGIGTVSPASPLSVNGGVAIGADYASSSTAPTNGLIVQGNVGIGTHTPTAPISIAGSADVSDLNFACFGGKRWRMQQQEHDEGNAGIIDYRGPWDAESLNIKGAGKTFNGTDPRNVRIWDTLSIGYSKPQNGVAVFNGNVGISTGSIIGSAKIHLAIGDEDTGLQQQGEGQLAILTKNTERVRVNDDGSVGIGTVSPASPLSVNGGVAIGADYASSSTAPTNGLIVQGNVGIGTKSPKYTLHLGFLNSQIHLGEDIVDGNSKWGQINRWANRLQVLSSECMTIALGDTKNDVVYVNKGNVSVEVDLDVKGELNVSGNMKIGGTVSLGNGGTSFKRVIMGVIGDDGSTKLGNGFTAGHPATGTYTITFDAGDDHTQYVIVGSIIGIHNMNSPSGTQINFNSTETEITAYTGNDDKLWDASFSFMAFEI